MVGFPCIERVRRLQDGTVAFDRLDLVGHGRDDTVADLFENEEGIVGFVIENFRPTDARSARFDEFDGHREPFVVAQRRTR